MSFPPTELAEEAKQAREEVTSPLYWTAEIRPREGPGGRFEADLAIRLVR